MLFTDSTFDSDSFSGFITNAFTRLHFGLFWLFHSENFVVWEYFEAAGTVFDRGDSAGCITGLET